MLSSATAPPGPPCLVLGTMLFGTHIEEATAYTLLDRFVERGGRWIDTADCYAFWLSESGRGDDSERVIGRWLAARAGIRERVLISTKIGAEPVGSGSWRGWPDNREGLSPQAVQRAVEGSLARLGIDRIDLLWLHQEDRATPIEDTVDAVEGFVASGRVARVGASNHPAWRVERARCHAVERGIRPIDAIQLASTYLRVRPDATPPGNDHVFGQLSREQRDHAADTGMEVWAYTPLLRGAYDDPGREVPDAYRHDGSTRRLETLAVAADRLGMHRGQVVLSWLAGAGVLPIVGVSSVAQLDEAIDAVSTPLPVDVRAQLDSVVP